MFDSSKAVFRHPLPFLISFILSFDEGLPAFVASVDHEKKYEVVEAESVDPIIKHDQYRVSQNLDINLDYLHLNKYSDNWNPFNNGDEDNLDVQEYMKMMAMQNDQYENYNMFKSRKNLLKQIYLEGQISGFEIESEEKEFVEKQGGDATFGEALYESMEAIVKILQFNERDVFYDLGSGVGKFNLFVHLATKIKKNVGIELSESRHSGALAALEAFDKHSDDTLCYDMGDGNAESQSSREITFIQGDIAKVDISDATIIFVSAVCFPQKLLQTLVNIFVSIEPGLCVVSLRSLPEHPRLKLTKELLLPTSWSKSYPYFFYEVIR